MTTTKGKEVLNTEITPEIKQLVQEEAALWGVSEGEIVRRALASFFGRKKLLTELRRGSEEK